MTIYTAGEIKATLMQAMADCPELEVDLARVTELDTAGAQLLLLVKREAAARGRRVTLTGHSPAVLDVVLLYNLAQHLGDPLVLPAQGRARAAEAMP